MEFDTNSPYNDPYSIFNQFDRIEFKYNHPLFQSELNGWQASADEQRQILADFSLNNGSIMSGMNAKLIPGGADTASNDASNDNLFVWSNLHANNAQVSNSQTYADDGSFNVLGNGNENTDYPDLKFSFNKPENQYVTLSFDIANIGGNIGGILHNIMLVPSNGITVKDASINGKELKDGEITNDSGYDMTDVQNDTIQLSNGNYNYVVITMDVGSVPDNGNSTLDIMFNVGYPPSTNGCNVHLDHFMLEAGTDVTPWRPSKNDQPSSYSTRKDLLQIYSGFVYLDGYVRYFPTQSIPVTGSGSEKIGLKLTRQDIDSSTDPDLVDHTSGSQSYGDSGADRDKYELNLTYGNDNCDAIIYYLSNGHVIADANYNREIALNNKLAQRTYEQSGSFLVNGMRILPHANQYNSDQINLQISPGVAYVMGHRIETDGTDTLPVPVVKSTYPRSGEPHELRKTVTDFGPYRFNLIKLNDQPLQLQRDSQGNGGISVTGIAYKSASMDTNLDGGNQLSPGDFGAGGASSIDFDKNDSDSCYIVYDGDRVDPNSYQVIDNKTIQWENNPKTLGGKPVDDGKTMTVYTKLKYVFMGPDPAYATNDTRNNYPDGQYTSDYVIIKQNGYYYLDFNEADEKADITGNKNVKVGSNSDLADLTDLSVEYYPYESREDLITLNYNGTFHDIQGQPAPTDSVQPPINYNGDSTLTMPIGYINIQGNNQTATATPYTVPRLPFTELNNMRSELKRLQANMDIIQGHEAAMAGVDPSTILDSFSDLFTNFSKADITSDMFNVTYNPNGYITPGFKGQGTIPLVLNGNDNPDDTGSDIVMKPNATDNGSTTYMDQSTWTGTLQLNNFGNLVQQGTLVCTPSVMDYIDDESTVLANVDYDNLSRHEADLAMDLQDMGLSTHGNNQAIKNLTPQQRQSIRDIELDPRTGKYRGDTPRQYNYENTTSITDYSLRRYLCSAWVHIYGSGFTPNSSGFRLYIPSANDISLPLRGSLPPNAKQSGIRNSDDPYGFDENPGIDGPDGTLQADSQGNVTGWFLIPSRTIVSGIHKVRISNNAGEFAEATIAGTQAKPTKENTINDVTINNTDFVGYQAIRNSQVASSMSNEFNQNVASLSNNIAINSGEEANDFQTEQVEMSNDTTSLSAAIENNKGLSQSMASSLSGDINATNTDLADLQNACYSYNNEATSDADSLSTDIGNASNAINELSDITSVAFSSEDYRNNASFSAQASQVNDYVNDIYSSINQNESNIQTLFNNVINAWAQLRSDRANLNELNYDQNIDTTAIDNTEQDIVNTTNDTYRKYQQAQNALSNLQSSQQVDEQNARNMFNTTNNNINHVKQQGQKAATFINNAVQTPRGLMYNIIHPTGETEQEWCSENAINPQFVDKVRDKYVMAENNMHYVPTYWESRWHKNDDYQRSQNGTGLYMGGNIIIPPHTGFHEWCGIKMSTAQIFQNVCGTLGSIGMCQPGKHPETEQYYKGRHGTWRNDSWTNTGLTTIGTVSFHDLFK